MTEHPLREGDVDPLLDEWLAGDLSADSPEELAILLADPNRADELERHRELRRQLRELPRESEPARDLWPAVAERIAKPSGRPLSSPVWRRTVAIPAWAALAALLAVAIGTSWLLYR
jgi:anti-sigma factor RsiW